MDKGGKKGAPAPCGANDDDDAQHLPVAETLTTLC